MSTRELIQIVQIDQDFCSLTYGSSPCQAAIGVTGPDRCFNTPGTCQDRENYEEGGKTLSFCKQNENSPRFGQTLIPSVVNVSTSPTTLNIAAASTDQGPLGRRASIKITLADHPYHDRLVDNYWRDRSYDPMERGTFWTKWLVRNPYHKGFPLRVVEIDLAGNLTTRTRNYIIDRVDWSSNGKIVVTALDMLAPLNEVLTPIASDGKLVDPITATTGSFEITSPSQYNTFGAVRIDDEVMVYTRSGNDMTVARGQYGTAAEDHDSGAIIQECQLFLGRVDQVLEELLVDIGQIDPAFVNVGGSWTNEGDRWLNGYNVSTLITEPTKVTTLIGELLEQCSCAIWWDELNQIIPLKAVRPVDPTIETINELNGDQHVILGSVSERARPEQRVDEVWFYYGIRNAAGDVDKASNYNDVRVTVAAAAQRDYKTQDKPVVRRIYSRWLPSGALGAVMTTSTRILQRLSNTPREIAFALDAKDRDVFTGDVVSLAVRSIVDQWGAQSPTLVQVTSTQDTQEGHAVEYVATLFDLSQRSAFITPNDYPVYSLASAQQRLFGAFICQNNGLMPNGDPGYLLS